MKYVNTLRRIIKIDEAIDRVPNEDRFDDILDKLFDKRDALVKSIKDYVKCMDRMNKELVRRSYIRRKQVRLACKYLGIDPFFKFHF